MKFLQRFPLVQTTLAKLFATGCHRKAQLHTHLKPPKANQTLKRFLNSNCTTKALLLLRDLLRRNPSVIDSYSFLFVIKACTQKPRTLEGKQLHTIVIKFGFQLIIHLQTSLMNMYAVMGSVLDAHHMFDEIPTKNVVCWTSLISAYVDNQMPDKALQLFRKMQTGNVEPDQVTLTVALSACADLGALEMGEWIQTFVGRKQELDADLSLRNALVNMYAKCGDTETARRLFDSIGDKDITTWTAMIVGHALHGQAKEALELFAAMKERSKNMKMGFSVVPNDVTFIGVLMACSHAGMVEEGKHHFKSMMKDYGLKPRDPHYGCMVDLFCRAGMLKEASDFILGMPMRPNAVMWRTLLGACSLHGNVKLGQQVRRKLLELEPSHVGDYVAMSNIYAAQGMWDKKTIVRDQIKHRRAPGCSIIAVGAGISQFIAADVDHPSSTEIYEALNNLIVSMKGHAYPPDLPHLAGS